MAQAANFIAACAMLWAASQLLPCVKTSFVFVFACMPAILYMHTACDLEVGCRLWLWDRCHQFSLLFESPLHEQTDCTFSSGPEVLTWSRSGLLKVNNAWTCTMSAATWTCVLQLMSNTLHLSLAFMIGFPKAIQSDFI